MAEQESIWRQPLFEILDMVLPEQLLPTIRQIPVSKLITMGTEPLIS